MPDLALELTGLSKSFGPVRALSDVSFDVRAGEIHGLIGANGSGKSTLVKALSGFHAADAGGVRVWGQAVSLPVSASDRHGMAVIHQDLGLADELSVTENVVSSTGFGVGRARKISWKRQRDRVRTLLERLEIPVDPSTSVGDLSRGNRTLVGVARAICELQEAGGSQHLLVTDEPTSALSTSEATALWDLLRRVAGGGGAALFISHHLNEVLDVCDRVTVLRDGRVVLTADCAGLTQADLVAAMVGAAVAHELEASRRSDGAGDGAAPVLQVRNLSGGGLDGVDVDVRAGEIVGITGLLGMGQDVVPEALGGLRTDVEGAVSVDGAAVRLGHEPAAREAGMVLVPAERQSEGLWLDGSVAENLGIVRARTLTRRGRFDRAAERRDAVALAERFDVRPRDVRRAVRDLSGGNQQKVLLAKWLQLDPRVVVLHEPTQGVDVAAKRDIHRLIRDYVTRTGAAVLMVSSDQDEIADHCDRVLVMAHGRIVAEVDPAEFTAERFMSLASVPR